MLLHVLVAHLPAGSFGVDVSGSVSASQWASLVGDCTGEGALHFAIPRVWRSSGTLDPVGVASVRAARANGIQLVDGYLFPHVSTPAGAQVNATFAGLRAAGATIGRLWLDIERYEWSADLPANQAFIKELVDACLAHGALCGVYTSANSWAPIVGSSWNYPATMGLHLWYPHYDNTPSFSDFSPFGGWSVPHIKQFAGDKTACGLSAGALDYNWMPGGPAPPAPSPSPSGSCKTFQSGLCPGPSSCMCTLGHLCSAHGAHGGAALNYTSRSSGVEGGSNKCAGECRTVVHNACPGGSDCMKDAGPC